MTEQRWLCVTCSATIDAHASREQRGRWLCKRGGRLCASCRGKLEAARPGASVSLGAGVMLVVVSETKNERGN